MLLVGGSCIVLHGRSSSLLSSQTIVVAAAGTVALENTSQGIGQDILVAGQGFEHKGMGPGHFKFFLQPLRRQATHDCLFRVVVVVVVVIAQEEIVQLRDRFNAEQFAIGRTAQVLINQNQIKGTAVLGNRG